MENKIKVLKRARDEKEQQFKNSMEMLTKTHGTQLEKMLNYTQRVKTEYEMLEKIVKFLEEQEKDAAIDIIFSILYNTL